MILPLLNIALIDFLCIVFVSGFLIAFACLALLYLTTHDVVPVILRYQKEKSFINPENGKRVEFPFNEENSSIALSVVVPAYNEEERLPIMLDETLEYLEQRREKDSRFDYEIIIVDDGSKDKTTEGVLSSRGRNILFVDADGATKFSDFDNVEQGLKELHGGKNDMAVSVGSRAHLQDEAVAQRSLFRNILMYGFHFLVYFLCVKGIKDTQCGFKLLTRAAALRLFSCLHVERWAFDVELLYLAQSLGIPIAEKAVNWQEIEGSKMVPVFSWIQMGKDLLLIRARYVINAWKINQGKPSIMELEA